jgi:hypothetical protein
MPSLTAAGPAGGPSRWAHAGLLILFPGFFVYHALVDRGLPPVLGGYSVLAAAAVVPVAAVGVAMALRQRGANWMDAGLSMFVAWTLLVLALAAASGRAPAIVASHLGALVQWLALYGVARALALDSPRLRRLCLASWIAMTALSLTQLSLESLLQGTLGLGVLEDAEALAGYQDYGLLYLIATLLCLALAERRGSRAAVLLVAVLVLFLNGARSEFAALVVGAFAIAVLRSRHPLLLLAVALGAAAAAVAAAETLVQWFPDNRILAVVESAYDNSASERQDMARHAWGLVQASPLTGDFGNYPPGEYAHNLLSVWVDFGVPGLALLVLLLLVPLLDTARRLAVPASRRPDHRLAVFALLLLALLLVLVAKTHTYNLLPFALGLYANDIATRRRTAAPALPTVPA